MKTEIETTTKWGLDPAHSEIQFKAKHLMITTVRGVFKEYEATIETNDEDFSTARVEFNARTNSVYTGNDQRDGHLRSLDFFNTEQFPKLTFTSTGVERKNDKDFILHGDLTIKNVTKPIDVKVEYLGTVTDPWGKQKAGFHVGGKLNRKDYDLKWNVITDAGSLLVGEEIDIDCNVQLVKLES
jgi:polyisoprenoid-binding protein YceI